MRHLRQPGQEMQYGVRLLLSDVRQKCKIMGSDPINAEGAVDRGRSGLPGA